MVYTTPVRSPSVESLKKELKFSTEKAKLFKDLCSKGKPQAAMKVADEAMNGSGVENLYPDAGYIYYVNMGDTYDKTLIFNEKSWYMWIGSWGNWAERNLKR